ncbi:MAG: type II toxin-antitoxin system Phd/YefM family antitoxin [Polyangiaceae bacterium]
MDGSNRAPINLYEAKSHLSELVDRAAGGEEVVIAKNGKPMARLVPLERPAKVVRFGLGKGKVKIAADFDAPLPEAMLALFEGRAASRK